MTTFKTFNDSAVNTLQIASNIVSFVEPKLAALKEDEHFNVAAYAKQCEEQGICEELFAATLIRTIVRNCEEYKSKRGRNGGVGRAPAKPVTEVKETQPTLASESEVKEALEVPELVETEAPAASMSVAELAESLRQNEVSVVTESDTPANESNTNVEQFVEDHFAFVSVG